MCACTQVCQVCVVYMHVICTNMHCVIVMCILTCHVGYMGAALYECRLHDMHICQYVTCHMCTCMVSALCYKSVCLMLYVHITIALYGCPCVDIMPCVALLGACSRVYIVCRWQKQKWGVHLVIVCWSQTGRKGKTGQF